MERAGSNANINRKGSTAAAPDPHRPTAASYTADKGSTRACDDEVVHTASVFGPTDQPAAFTQMMPASVLPGSDRGIEIVGVPDGAPPRNNRGTAHPTATATSIAEQNYGWVMYSEFSELQIHFLVEILRKALREI
ncbi:hypothetical protein GCM10027269_60270 [Kribbella endophytica]